jgi:hypothetical protein
LARPCGGACAPHAMVKNCAIVMGDQFDDRSTRWSADRSRLSVVIPVTVKLVAATTAFFIMPPARRLADRIVALIDGRR